MVVVAIVCHLAHMASTCRRDCCLCFYINALLAALWRPFARTPRRRQHHVYCRLAAALSGHTRCCYPRGTHLESWVIPLLNT